MFTDARHLLFPAHANGRLKDVRNFFTRQLPFLNYSYDQPIAIKCARFVRVSQQLLERASVIAPAFVQYTPNTDSNELVGFYVDIQIISLSGDISPLGMPSFDRSLLLRWSELVS